MKILKKELKKGIITLQVQDLDDLWYISQIIEPGDLIKGRTIRKIKLTDKTEANTRIFKKPVSLVIAAEKVEFHKYSDILRVSGVVQSGPEDVPVGSHHSFSVEPQTVLTICKTQWFTYHLDYLRQSIEAKPLDILICVHDREEAVFAILKKQGYQILASIKGEVQKKTDATLQTSDFYQQLLTQIQEYVARYKIRSIIVASPAFWKEELLRYIKDPQLKGKITLATCNHVGSSAINEVLKRSEIKTIMQNERTALELNQIEELLAGISKQGAVAYGLKQTEQAVDAGAVATLLISNNLIHETRQSNSFAKINQLMKKVESMKGEITIINSDNEAGKKLDSLGGMAALLRYKLY
ncbi:MAG: mRNA surveillance protein pelota [Candidatus Woesearchaeota archaeon]